MIRIVWCDNFDRDTVDDRLVATFERAVEANICLVALQAMCTESGEDWYKIVPPDYKLKKWGP